MSERTVELDQPLITDPAADALREANDRAERAEAELAKLKAHSRQIDTPSVEPKREAPDAANEVSIEAMKQPPSPNTAANVPNNIGTATHERGSAEDGGEMELRKDPMMAHLLDSLNAGTDIGHYGRLVFSMVARHFLPHAAVLAYLTKDKDFSEEQATQMLHQVEGRDYSPPRRERLLEWQREQEFQFIDATDPDSGNLYRNLTFPQEIYDHISHYQEAKSAV